MTSIDHEKRSAPLVSVVIPTYNRERFVDKAINSVLSQSFNDYEIIVVDDGSTDETPRVLASYKDRVKYIYQKNSGVSSARNAGIREARGEWVAFLDSDDKWKTDYLLTQIGQISKFPHAVAHMTNAVSVQPSGEQSNLFIETNLLDEFKTRQCVVLENPLRIIIKYGCWCVQSTVVRR
ncbi:MAG: glycosyltransferase family 2 protein, partial [Syntrophobacteraceae bacterium]